MSDTYTMNEAYEDAFMKYGSDGIENLSNLQRSILQEGIRNNQQESRFRWRSLYAFDEPDALVETELTLGARVPYSWHVAIRRNIADMDGILQYCINDYSDEDVPHIAITFQTGDMNFDPDYIQKRMSDTISALFEHALWHGLKHIPGVFQNISISPSDQPIDQIELPETYDPIWLMNSTTALTIATAKLLNGRYLTDEDMGLKDSGVLKSFFEYPLIYNEWASDEWAIYGDFKKGYEIINPQFYLRYFEGHYLGSVTFGARLVDEKAFVKREIKKNEPLKVSEEYLQKQNEYHKRVIQDHQSEYENMKAVSLVTKNKRELSLIQKATRKWWT